ncbi:protein TIME FOR COFFEE-like [Telopea speciosissima]|uniref:protein TIME FOR COFFEE-like n=1 Tax=Telopea speciosissima TaxID=54955 RepID=UPI001CC71864|nr:protein TIME FOR COFFEE-like [Telopea speciosissima]
MEKNRVSRRETSSVIGESFSLSRRRSRSSIGFRDSSGVCDAEDDGSDSMRDQSNEKKERSSRRRRLNSNGRYHVDRDEENGSSNESMNDDDNDEDDRHVLGSGTGGSFSMRIERPKHPQLKGRDDMLGVSVPRRARSASVKRFQDSCSIVRQFSSPLPIPTSAASPSPPSSNASTKAPRKMMKPMTKAKLSKTSKVSISESEVEVAQFLYGLTRLQSHQSPVKSDAFRSPSQVDHKHNSSNEVLVLAPSKISSPRSTPVSPPSSQLSILPQNSSSIPTSVTVPKRKKPRAVQLEDGYDSTMMACASKPSVCNNLGNSSNSSIPASSSETEGIIGSPAAKPEVLSAKSDKNIISNEESTSKPETSLPVSSPSLTSFPENLPLTEGKPNAKSSIESKTSVSLEKNLQTTDSPKAEEAEALEVDLQASVDVVEKESSPMGQDISAPLISDVKLDTPNITSRGSVASEETKMMKFEIDLMAPPKNDDDVLDEVGTNASQTSNPDTLNPVIGKARQTEVNINTEGQVEADEARRKHNYNVLDLEQNKQMKETVKVAALDKQLYNEKKSGSSNVDDQNHLDKSDNKQPSQKLLRNSARPTDRTGLPVGIMASTLNPISITVPSWPGGRPPFGYLGSSPSNLSGLQVVQAIVPKEGNCAIPNPPFMMPPQARPSRCATHCFIARNIHFQQQTARLKPFWHAAGSAAPYGGKPYNLNMLPPSESILFGAGSLVRNPNMVPNGNHGPASVMTLNGYNSTGQLPNSFADNQKKPCQLPQSAHQMPAFIFPFTQSRTSGIKSSNGVENASLVSASSGSVAAPSASVNSKFSNIAAKSDPQYLSMLHGSYPFPIPAAYRAHMPQQQRPGAPPLFGGSLYPAHLLQLQSRMLPHTHNQNQSTSSVSSSKSPAESCRNEAEPVQDQEGGSEVQVLPIQKDVPGQNVSGIPNFHQNFAIVPPFFRGNQPQQQPGDPNLHMRLKGLEATAGSFHSGHSMLQTMPNFGLHQYWMGGGNIPNQAVNQSKAPSKSASVTVTDKFLEPSHGQSLPVSARQQHQKQVVARTQPLDSSVSAAGGSSRLDHTDRILAGYSNAGTNFQAGTMGFPQWKMPPSERAAPGSLPGNFVQSGMAVAAVAETQNAGSSDVKASRGASPPMNPTRIAPSSGLSVMALSDQAQCQPKTQQLYFFSESTHQNSGSSCTLSSQRHSTETSSERQAMFADALNWRRPENQQAQPSLTVGYLDGGKNPAVFGHPLAGSSVAVMAAASYAQSAANFPMKSAEQKPAAA